jgi:transposase, IS6 family
MDETYVKVAGQWVYRSREIDQCGQVINVLVSSKRNLAVTCRFFMRALVHGSCPTEVTTDWAPAYPRVIEKLIPAGCHVTKQYANNVAEVDHSRLKARLRPMRGTTPFSTGDQCRARVHPDLRRGHYELGWGSTYDIGLQQSSPNSPTPSVHPKSRLLPAYATDLLETSTHARSSSKHCAPATSTSAASGDADHLRSPGSAPRPKVVTAPGRCASVMRSRSMPTSGTCG